MRSEKQRAQDYRDRIRADPEKYEKAKEKERERYRRRVREKRNKPVSSKEKDRIRNETRKRVQKYRLKKKILSERKDMTQTCSSKVDQRKLAGLKKRRKYRQKLIKEKEDALKRVKSLQKVNNKLRKQLSRSKAKQAGSPEKIINKLIQGKKVPAEIKKKLLFGEVLAKEVKRVVKEEPQRIKKRELVEKLNGQLIRRYKYLTFLKKMSSKRLVERKKISLKRRNAVAEKKVLVLKFLKDDANSKLMPGKRDTKTRNKCKKQKRLLSDTLKNLYFKFKEENPTLKIAYSFFCKLRPFWIVPPKPNQLDTCLCVTHENFSLLVKKLSGLKMIEENNATDVIRSLTCPDKKEVCLERTCENCMNNKIVFKEYEGEDDVVFEKWMTKKSKIVVKGVEKLVQRTVKENIETKKKILKEEFDSTLGKFMKHLFYMVHQHAAVKNVKNNLGKNDFVLLMDFSENYVCKYNREIQSAHFGSSKKQISLHTVVAYYDNNAAEEKKEIDIRPKSFCTMTENRDHDAPAIIAHLNPVIQELSKKFPKPDRVHCVSDGPTTQYRNRFMFGLMPYLGRLLNVQSSLIWHYSEAGHGKSSADGVGGTIKRSADRVVACGEDVSSFEKLYAVLQKSTKSIKVLPIDEKLMVDVKNTLPKKIPKFKGTMNVHQVVWNKDSDHLKMRRLSCLQCVPTEDCPHFGLGQLKALGHEGDDSRNPHVEVEKFQDSPKFGETGGEIQPLRRSTRLRKNRYILDV